MTSLSMRMELSYEEAINRNMLLQRDAPKRIRIAVWALREPHLGHSTIGGFEADKIVTSAFGVVNDKDDRLLWIA